MGYNVTALNEEITKIEQAKSNISNILYEKGRPVTNNSALSDIVSNILPLSNIRRYNTNVEKNLDKTVENGTVSMVYGPYINSDSTTIFTTNIYLPKQLSVTANDVRTLGSGTILAKLVYQSSGNDFAQIIINTVDNKYIVKLEILDYTLNIDDIIWELNTDNVYTRNDAITGYRILNTESAVIYSTTVTTRNLAYEILQVSSTYKFNGLYLYNVANWEPLPLGVTANISTIFTGKTALTDNGIVTGIGTSDATAIAGDIWKNTAYVKGEKLTGTLQVTQNVTREELDSKIDMWNTFTNFSTVGNNLSYLMDNLPQKLLPIITANDIVDISGMYYNCKNLIEVDITKLNTLNTTNMDNTFGYCSNLTNLNLNSWKSNNLQSTKGMFDNCVNVMSIDVANWNVINLKDTTSMFENCKNLTNLNVSRWNTYNVETMPKMFKNCQHMENISFTNWNVGNVTNMEAIFESCDRFTNESIANVVNMLPDATQLTNNNAFNLGIDMDRYNQLQLLALNQKNYIGAPLPYNMYYNIVNLDDGSYYLLNKGDDLDKDGKKLSNYINSIYNNGVYDISIGDNILKDATISMLNRLFYMKSLINSINLSDLNTTNVISMSHIFFNCRNLVDLNIDNWDTSNVLYMDNMFYRCNKLRNIDISNWDVSNVIDISGLFTQTPGPAELDLSRWKFKKLGTICAYKDSGVTGPFGLSVVNLNLANWEVSNVGSLEALFGWKTYLRNVDVSSWNTSNVTSIASMFSGDLQLVNIIGLNEWDTSNVTNMYSIFANCRNLDNLTLVTSNFDTTRVKNMSSIFINCYNLVNINISNWNTCNVTRMENMFTYCYNLANIDVSNWDTSNVMYMQNMFTYCNNLTSLNVSNWNTINVTTLNGAFQSCTNLINIDVSNWDTSNVITLNGAFQSCTNLTTLDVSNWDTSNVRDMGCLFCDCQNLTTLDVSNWDTSNVVYIGNTPLYLSTSKSIFANMFNLRALNVSNWNLHKVNTTSYMFSRCTNLTELNCSTMNLCNVISIANMFNECVNLKSINVSEWNLSKVNNSQNMFRNCKSLLTIDVSNWNTSNFISTTNMFSHCESLTSIDVSNWSVSKVTSTSCMFADCYNIYNINISNWNVVNLKTMDTMFAQCNNLSDESIDSIINMCLNATNLTYKNLSINNGNGPFYHTNITNSRYQNRWEELTAAGWTY